MKKTYKINIHSFIDLITNSSTEIFTVVNQSSLKYVKELINKILSDVGSDKTCDDLYTVKLEMEDYYLDKLRDNIGLYFKNEGYIDIDQGMVTKAVDSALRGESTYAICLPVDDGEGCGMYTLEIRSKNTDDVFPFEYLFDNIFKSEERYC